MFLPKMLRSVAAVERTAGQYELREKIGEGGMGEVWLAEHELLGRPAAVKLMRPKRRDGDDDGAADRRAQELFVREAQATAILRSPHTVELYEFGITLDARHYYVMEYLEGLDLGKLTVDHGPIPAERVVYLLRQVCDSLHEAHQHGLVHGDIKPANILSCCLGGSWDFVKVLDFGLVRKEKGRDISEEPTLDGVTPGTPAFMPPEIAMGCRHIDGRSDIYALGCVGYYLLTGAYVFDGETPVATVVDHIQTPPVPPSRRTEMAIPEALERVILRCLEKKVEDRFQSAEELSCALAAVPLRRSWDNARASDWWQRNEPEVGRRRTTMAPSDRGLTAASRDTARRGTAYPQHRP